MLAARHGNNQCLEVLLDHGALIDKRSKENETALVFASLDNHYCTAQMLINRGCETNVVDEYGFHPILLLCKDPTCLKLMLDKGTDPNFVNHSISSTLLGTLCRGKYSESLCLLLQYNCDFKEYHFRSMFKRCLHQEHYRNVLILLTAAILLGVSFSGVRSDFNSCLSHNCLCARIKSWTEYQLSLCPETHKLSHQCRRCIRDTIRGVNFAKKIKCLPLPQSLRNYLMLPELDSLHIDEFDLPSSNN